ncbi:cytochrome b/b6 domain-containing protein [Pseudarthrobacter sp. IC2-21]|uniref:cytochrome b/b6 domain-containing protein n=1 Tax=Pseudarthrobacter sp. IC2-21 TaxID=3092262 RepID=UPI002A69A17D|nr:cytochrome b/b6 domain-containing protein [Pseudarthrobacter sp. IC2-21]
MPLLTTPGSPPNAETKTRTSLIKPVLIAVAAMAVVVLVAKAVRGLDAVQDFLLMYPGHSALPANAPIGLPAWLGWQHFLNAFFIVLIIRTGWQVRTTARPKAYWTRKNTGLFKTRNKPGKISLELWFHLSLDVLWLLNGLVFVVLLFVTGGWMRIVPTSWDIFPNALSTALQYASLNWPAENGWVNYNALQVLAYFAIVFIAAPLAAVTGVRMSPAWPKGNTLLDNAYPIDLARKIHFPVMLFFTAFVVMHVTLVLSTGAIRNLNHMFATRDDAGWLGFWIFLLSVAVMVGAWLLARPVFLRPLAMLTGKVTK